MAAIRIENDALSVVVAPHYGARVTNLIDKATRRDWMAPGGESRQTGEDAVYLAGEAVGWDECFPTVSPWDASGTTWGRPLRDHGDLWGRPFVVDSQSATAVTTGHTTDEFRFERELEVSGRTLTARYAVTNTGAKPLPYLWALHGLLAVTPEDKIDMAGVDEVAASYLSIGGKTLVAPRVAWPGPDRSVGLPLDLVRPASEQFAGKLYASDLPTPLVSVVNARGSLDIGWRNDEIGHVGLWLNYGGWPQPGRVHHIAIEPTTAPVDHLGQAIERGDVATLAPGETHRWTITLTCRVAAS